MTDPSAIPSRLLEWYDAHRRVLPWRARPGERADPYRVWLSEIMLQQTTVATVGPYFAKFLTLWPTVADLAAATRDDVLTAWAGLGYYARARNLHACAQAVVERFAGRFPDTEAALLDLPGVGAYTAAAVAAIAFDRPATVVDGNVERVVARLFAVETPFPDAKPEVRRLAATLTPHRRPGDFAQAMMDLGATICAPRSARCVVCPLNEHCRAFKTGVADRLPAKREKATKPHRFGVAFWLTNGEGAVWVERRPEKGLLGGMAGFPGGDWLDGEASAEASARASAPPGVAWSPLPGHVRHVFTHFSLDLAVWRGVSAFGPFGDGEWVRPADIGGRALPTVMRKVIRHVMENSEVVGADGVSVGTAPRKRGRPRKNG